MKYPSSSYVIFCRIGELTSISRLKFGSENGEIYFEFLDRKNKANLEAIEKAIFVLCLDQPPPPSTQSPSVMEMPTSSVTARQCLHGDGTQYNSANRWFDKIIQV